MREKVGQGEEGAEIFGVLFGGGESEVEEKFLGVGFVLGFSGGAGAFAAKSGVDGQGGDEADGGGKGEREGKDEREVPKQAEREQKSDEKGEQEVGNEGSFFHIRYF